MKMTVVFMIIEEVGTLWKRFAKSLVKIGNLRKLCRKLEVISRPTLQKSARLLSAGLLWKFTVI